MDEKTKKKEPEYGLVVIESGPFAGWLGEYDDNEGRRRIVYPLHPFNACPYTLVTKVRDLTPAERERYERGERAVVAARSKRLAAGEYDEPGWSTGESVGGMLDSVTRDVQGRRAPADAPTPGDTPRVPEGYEDDLSGYGPVVFDGICGEPVGWGFNVNRHLGDARFEALRAHGKLHCIAPGSWALVVRWLTPADARRRYGDVTTVERGPRGGFRSVTYGNKRFESRCVDPDAVSVGQA